MRKLLSTRFTVAAIVALVATFAMTVVAFADGGSSSTNFDMVGVITSSLNEFLVQMLAVIGVIAPIVIAIVGAQIGIGYGIRLWRNLTSR